MRQFPPANTPAPLNKGIHNLVKDGELVPVAAATEALNWVTFDDRIELMRGRALLGAEGSSGGVKGDIIAYKHDGSSVRFRKINTRIQYKVGSGAWTDVITGLTEAADYTFAPYTSLAGTFVYIGGVDGLYKIHIANPGSYSTLYDETKNYKGQIMIDTARMFLWDREEDKTGLYLSHIDPQGSNYTTVSGETIDTGDGAATNFTGTLAFKAGGSTRTCFAISITDGTETFTDDRLGTLTGDQGGTGTINYTTGAYDITFDTAPTNLQDIDADYQWEDSNTDGVTDFTFSGTRLAGEGDVFSQDIGGDAILTVKPFEGKQYSIKERSAYELFLTNDDTNATNQVYRQDIGVPNERAAVSTSKGIIFMNTANPEKPVLTILERNPIGDNLLPRILVPHFDFSPYVYDECVVETWGEYVVMSAKTSGASVNNRTFLINLRQETVDVTYYGANTFTKDGGILYAGDSFSDTHYEFFTGFDDDDFTIDPNYWVGRDEKYGLDNLKKVKKLRLKGQIGKDQVYKVYAAYDGGGFEHVGTIRGDARYVDTTRPYTIGSSMIGTNEIGGGGSGATAYDYYAELKLKTPKYKSRQLKFEATGLGYLSIYNTTDFDIRIFEEKIPKRFRQKQNISLDGQSTDQ